MYDDSYDNDGTDFWRGYDSSTPSSPVMQESKATFAHIEHSPSRSFSIKPPITAEIEIAHPRPEISTTTVVTTATGVPELVFTQHSPTTSTPDSHPQPLSAKLVEEDEDASYWGQYSTVQGSGDSTVPSPRLENGKKPSEVDEYGRPLLDVDVDAVEVGADAVEYEPTASLRGDVYVRGSVGVEEEFAEEPFGRGFDDAFAAVSPRPVVVEEEQVGGGLGLTMEEEVSDSGSSVASSGATNSEGALEEAMRGIYWLWKGQNEERTVEQFLALVKRAVAP